MGRSGAAAAATGGTRGRGQDRGVGEHGGVRGGLEAVLGDGVGVQAGEAGVLRVLVRCHGAVAVVAVPSSWTPVRCVDAVWRDAGRVLKGSQHKVGVTLKQPSNA